MALYRQVVARNVGKNKGMTCNPNASVLQQGREQLHTDSTTREGAAALRHSVFYGSNRGVNGQRSAIAPPYHRGATQG